MSDVAYQNIVSRDDDRNNYIFVPKDKRFS